MVVAYFVILNAIRAGLSDSAGPRATRCGVGVVSLGIGAIDPVAKGVHLVRSSPESTSRQAELGPRIVRRLFGHRAIIDQRAR